MRILIVGNGPMGNRGCQAIQWTSIDLIRKKFPEAQFTICNYNGDHDQKTNTDPQIRYYKLYLEKTKRFSIGFWGWQLLKRFYLGLSLFDGYRTVSHFAPSHDIVLSFGGDLYAQTYGPFQMLNYISMGKAALKAGKPFVIWPATIGPFDERDKFDQIAIEHIRRCSLVLCRDQFSLNELSRLGIRSNSRLVSDPAFLLEPKKPKEELELFAPLSESIGINIGPNLARHARCSTRDEWAEKVANSLLYLHKKCNYPILLVPHIVNQVNEQQNCDYTFYCKINKILDSNGVRMPIIPPTLNADELKWVIGKLFAFVGSRTHSTIAAFSSCVPCGCIGYSTKSAALCDTFYGNTELHLSSLNFSSKELFSLVSKLAEERSNLSKQIQYKLPEITRLSHDSVKYLKEVI